MRHRHETSAGAERPIHHPHVTYHATIGIELRVEDQRAQAIVMALRRWNSMDDRFEDLLDADAVLGAGEDAFAAFHHQQLLDLAHHALGIGSGQIDLVDHWNDREIVFERKVIVCQRLRLDALSGVDDQHGPFAGR